jgi:hypothetical protein
LWFFAQNWSRTFGVAVQDANGAGCLVPFGSRRSTSVLINALNSTPLHFRRASRGLSSTNGEDRRTAEEYEKKQEGDARVNGRSPVGRPTSSKQCSRGHAVVDAVHAQWEDRKDATSIGRNYEFRISWVGIVVAGRHVGPWWTEPRVDEDGAKMGDEHQSDERASRHRDPLQDSSEHSTTPACERTSW